MVLDSETELLDQGQKVLAARLPEGWSVERSAGAGPTQGPADALFSFSSRLGGSSGAALVEAKRKFSPADVERLLGGLTRRLRNTFGSQTIE